MGYDDNVFQTPTHSLVQPDQKFPVLRSFGSPATTVVVTIPSGDPLVPDSVKTVEIPAVPPKFGSRTISALAAAKRTGSFVTRGGAKFEAQFASRRTLFTFDLDVGEDYYWNRPGKKTDPNDKLALIYLRRLSGRAQFTIAVDASYQTQPNFSQPNTPTNNTGGSYLTSNAKADLSYRWTPRVSSVTSVSYNSLYSQETARQNSDYNETTFGTELRYLFSPQLTLIGEARYSSIVHPNSPSLDTGSYILLLGGEVTLSRRFNASIRLGESLRTFDETGDQRSAPYGEGTLSYRVGPRTTVALTTHYGFEESQNVNSELLTLRTGLSLSHVFTARLQGSVELNFVRSSTTSTFTTTSDTNTANGTSPSSTAANTSVSDGSSSAAGTSASNSTPPKTETVSTDQVSDTIDATLALRYALSRHWGFNLTYSYTALLGPEKSSDYYRQRVFLGAEYHF